MSGEHFREINQPGFYRGQKRWVLSDHFIVNGFNRLKTGLLHFFIFFEVQNVLFKTVPVNKVDDRQLLSSYFIDKE